MYSKIARALLVLMFFLQPMLSKADSDTTLTMEAPASGAVPEGANNVAAVAEASEGKAAASSDKSKLLAGGTPTQSPPQQSSYQQIMVFKPSLDYPKVFPVYSEEGPQAVINFAQHNLREPFGYIIGVRAQSIDSDVTRIEFDVTRDFATRLHVSNFPFKLVFDAPMPYKWRVAPEQLQEPGLARLMNDITYDVSSGENLRIIANLKFPVTIESAGFFPKPGEDGVYEFLVDVKQVDSTNYLLNSSTLVVPALSKYYRGLEHQHKHSVLRYQDERRELALNKWIESYLRDTSYPHPTVQSNTSQTSEKVIVVIDPGHGGRDPGATTGGGDQIKEKAIVLDIAKMIRDKLLKNPNISVVLMRKGDYFIPLKDRILWAKALNADLFVSIHADKAPDPESSGLSVYTLSEKASDVQTEVIATDQNKSDVIAGAINEDTSISRILLNLLQRVKLNDSKKLARSIVDSASNDLTMLAAPIRSAGFAVLQVPQVPAVLVETGFLSNSKDTSNLTTQHYRERVSAEIANGIENYLLKKGKIKTVQSW